MLNVHCYPFSDGAPISPRPFLPVRNRILSGQLRLVNNPAHPQVRSLRGDLGLSRVISGGSHDRRQCPGGDHFWMADNSPQNTKCFVPSGWRLHNRFVGDLDAVSSGPPSTLCRRSWNNPTVQYLSTSNTPDVVRVELQPLVFDCWLRQNWWVETDQMKYGIKAVIVDALMAVSRLSPLCTD